MKRAGFHTATRKTRARLARALLLVAMPGLLFAKDDCDQAPYQRIVAVGGAITETIYALDQGHRIVAADTTSYYPKAAGELPKVGYQRALSVEGILSQKPDLIIASDQAGPPRSIRQLEDSGLRIHTLPSATNIEEVLNNIRVLGRMLCARKESRDLILALEHAQRDLPRLKPTDAKRVLFIMQHGGGAPMVAGTETSAASIIALAGAQNAVDHFEGYKPLTPEALALYRPEVILTTDQGLQQVGGSESLFALPGISLTPAGQRRALVAMDALLLLGFGPRTLQAAQELHRQLNNGT